MRRSIAPHACVFVRVVAGVTLAIAPAASVGAAVLPGGGGPAGDCLVVLDAPQANHPAPPAAPREVRCADGDASCDTDGLRNGECIFEIGICLNSSEVVGCSPERVDLVEIDHADDNGDPKFDPDWQALQLRTNLLGLPENESVDDCTLPSSITVRLDGPDKNSRMRKHRKKLALTAEGRASGSEQRDKDKLKLTCTPGGDAIYLPTDLYEGTFDRIRQQVFQASCALSSCHDSEGQAGGMILLPTSAYSNTLDVVPDNNAAAIDGLLRVDGSGDPDNSFLYRKITGDLESGYGSRMPLTGANVAPELVEIIRLWIIGDGVLGPAPAAGWVLGTDQ